jgi:AraC-like DNA-binding protein
MASNVVLPMSGAPALTALGKPDKLFGKSVMESGWTASGQIEVANEPQGFAALATRFSLEATGQLKAAIERPANAIGMKMASGGIESQPHAHHESQLLYMERGELTCEASNALWLVPPQSALWIPGGVIHRISARAPLQGYSAFVAPDAAPNLPRECCAVSVTPLFRELLQRLASRPALYNLDGPDARMVSVLLDELARVEVEAHRLPMPRDPRLRQLVDAMTAEPASAATAKAWAKRIGVGERTLNRLLVAETGLSFGRWRQQLHIILAIQRLARGASVQEVALELGYESSSSFVTMFRKALGTPPAKYMAERLQT